MGEELLAGTEAFASLKQLLAGKRVVLIGNATAALAKKRPVDDHYDVVIRLNQGYSAEKTGVLGTRTDVLCLSQAITDDNLQRLNPGKVIWMSPKREALSDCPAYLAGQVDFYPVADWELLNDSLNGRPSTGCMVLDFLVNHMPVAALDVIGFDFFQSGNWYQDGPRVTGWLKHWNHWIGLRRARLSKQAGPHHPERERVHILSLMARHSQVRLVR